MLTIKIMPHVDVDLYKDRFLIAACAIGLHAGCRVDSVTVEHGEPLGYDHQVAISLDAKYDNETFSKVNAALRANLGDQLCVAWIGGE